MALLNILFVNKFMKHAKDSRLLIALSTRSNFIDLAPEGQVAYGQM